MLRSFVNIIVFIAPAICSFVCTVLVLLSTWSHSNPVSTRIRGISALSMFCVGVLWIWPGLSVGVDARHIGWIALCGLIVAAIEITLAYGIIHPKAESSDPFVDDHEKQKEILSAKAVEDYFSKNRPFIDPGFKLEDLAGAMGASRSEMSAFVNRTFGMNFKRYVNRWRLDEYKRLMSLPSNERKNAHKIMLMAGFADARHYKRVSETEHSNDSK